MKCWSKRVWAGEHSPRRWEEFYRKNWFATDKRDKITTKVNFGIFHSVKRLQMHSLKCNITALIYDLFQVSNCYSNKQTFHFTAGGGTIRKFFEPTAFSQGVNSIKSVRRHWMPHNKNSIRDDITWEIEANDFYGLKETYASITHLHEQDSTTFLISTHHILNRKTARPLLPSSNALKSHFCHVSSHCLPLFTFCFACSIEYKQPYRCR